MSSTTANPSSLENAWLFGRGTDLLIGCGLAYLLFIQVLLIVSGATGVTDWPAFLVIALALGELEVPRGWTVWGALLVTGVFASALAYLIQVWAQRRLSAARIALVFSLETVFAGLFGYWLSGDRLGWLGWGGCAVILAGIVVAEPSAAATLRRLVGWRPTLLPSD